MAEAPEVPDSDLSSDDWDYRSRSSSADSVHQSMIFTARQVSCDSDSSSLDLSYLNLDSSSLGANVSQFNSTSLATINLSGN
ncbi:unnamed protein product, partial [Oppiella nova]